MLAHPHPTHARHTLDARHALAMLVLAAGLLFVWLTFFTSTAHADYGDPKSDGDGDRDSFARFMLGLDLDYAAALSWTSVETGGGGALRLGSELDLILVTLIPELDLRYHAFEAQGVRSPTVSSAKLGGRLRIGKIIEPGLYAHVGVAHVGGGPPSYTAPALDAGITLDLTLLPLIDLGVHAAYNTVIAVGDDDGLSYGTFGAHAALVI